MNRERLEQMVTMLRGLPKGPKDGEPEFHLRGWYCGTTACAVGFACMSPVFKEQGLAWDHVRQDPVYAGESSWYAVEKFFELTAHGATYLFYDMEYPDDGENTTANDVADRIESFLAEAATA